MKLNPLLPTLIVAALCAACDQRPVVYQQQPQVVQQPGVVYQQPPVVVQQSNGAADLAAGVMIGSMMAGGNRSTTIVQQAP